MHARGSGVRAPPVPPARLAQPQIYASCPKAVTLQVFQPIPGLRVRWSSAGGAGSAGGPRDGGCPAAPGVRSLPPARGQGLPQGWDGAGWEVRPSPKTKLEDVWEEVYAPGVSPRGANPFPTREHRLSNPCVRLIHAQVVSGPYPPGCRQRYVFCGRIVCLQSHITLTKSKEEIYLSYFAFRQLCPGTVAPILIDYTAIFLNFSSKYDAVSHLNHLSRSPLQRPYHSNFSHVLCLCVCVWYFTLISSPSLLQ